MIRYLENVKGVDTNALRQEMSDNVQDLITEPNGLLWKGDSRTYTKDGMTYIISHENCIVTMYPYDPQYDPEDENYKSKRQLRKEAWRKTARAALSDEARRQIELEMLAELAEPAIQEHLDEMRRDEAHEYNPEFVAEIKRRDALPPEATFSYVGDMLDWLDKDESD